MQTQYQFAIDQLTGQSKDDAADLGLEMHAISSSCKPVAGWLARDGIQECREACAGHGYLKGTLKTVIKNDKCGEKYLKNIF